MYSSRTHNDYEYVTHRTEEGTLPIILTAPHGGWVSFNNQDEYFMERKGKGIVTKGDLHTMNLLHKIEEYLIRMSGLKPHFVAAKFHRKYIDANRNYLIPSEQPYNQSCTAAESVYKIYHNQIKKCISHILKGSPNQRVLLLDLHGMRYYSNFIVVGSKNGSTCSLNYLNEPREGFLWHLRNICGDSMILPRIGEKDISKYSGGYTIQNHYGNRVDCLQLEFGYELRSENNLNIVAEAVGEALMRTFFPLKYFLKDIAPVNEWSEIHIEKVESKLELIQIYTPNDLLQSLDFINESFRKANFKKFNSVTKRNIKDYFFSNVHPESSNTIKSSLLFKIIKRVFVEVELYQTNEQNILQLFSSYKFDSVFLNAHDFTPIKLYQV